MGIMWERVAERYTKMQAMTLLADLCATLSEAIDDLACINSPRRRRPGTPMVFFDEETGCHCGTCELKYRAEILIERATGKRALTQDPSA